MSPSILPLFLRYYVQCHCILPLMFIPVYTCLWYTVTVYTYVLITWSRELLGKQLLQCKPVLDTPLDISGKKVVVFLYFIPCLEHYTKQSHIFFMILLLKFKIGEPRLQLQSNISQYKKLSKRHSCHIFG